MARERRVLRLQQLILELVAETIQQEALDPGLGLVSITRVKLATDLSEATVYWSCLGRDAAREKTDKAMHRVLPLLQRRVAQGLGIRTTPRLELRFDPTLEQAQRLETIFHKLAEERGEEPEEADDALVEGEADDTGDDATTNG